MAGVSVSLFSRGSSSPAFFASSDPWHWKPEFPLLPLQAACKAVQEKDFWQRDWRGPAFWMQFWLLGQIFHFIRNAHGSAILVFDSRRLFGLLLRQGRINSPGTAQIKKFG